jgi:alpha-glucosidase
LQIYPDGTSRFELYEDDGRSNAYRQGCYALTPIESEARPDRLTVRVGTPTGDASVVPPDRRYLLRLRVAPPAGIVVDERDDLSAASPGAAGPGWWMDEAGFLCIRPPRRPALTVVVTPAAD